MIINQTYTYGLFDIKDSLASLELICFKFNNKIEETLFYNLCQKYRNTGLIKDINTGGRITTTDKRLKNIFRHYSKVKLE